MVTLAIAESENELRTRPCELEHDFFFFCFFLLRLVSFRQPPRPIRTKKSYRTVTCRRRPDEASQAGGCQLRLVDMKQVLTSTNLTRKDMIRRVISTEIRLLYPFASIGDSRDQQVI